MKKISENSSSGGQVMLVTVLMLSAVFLSATVIAGTLMSYQLGQVTRVTDSTKAIFAADAGVERALFNAFRCNATTTPDGFGNGWNDNVMHPNPDAQILCKVTGAAKTDPTLICPSVAPSGSGIPPAFCNGAGYQVTIQAKGNPGVHDPTASSTQVDIIKATGNAGKTARAFQLDF